MPRSVLASTTPAQAPARAPHEVWRVLSLSPVFPDFVEIIEARLSAARDVYETNPADEGRRQRVLELRELLTFLTSGDLP
ncbi:MAG: hypothetical protein ACRC8U_09735 [Brooklawnia sp.]